MEKSEHQKFIDSIKESQENSRKTLDKIESTLSGVTATLNDIKITNQNIDKIKDQFSQVMDQLAISISRSFVSDPLKKIQGKFYPYLPKQGHVQQLLQDISNFNDILIITGAGVSVDSGIPTFRGKNGLYQTLFQYDGKSYQPEQFINSAFYQLHPQPIWKWIDDIHQMSINSKPNQTHYLIDQLAKILSTKGKKVVLVTQNIDDLHLKPIDKEYEYYNVHGNVKHMRCSSNHLTPYNKNLIGTKCQENNCMGQLRPHVLFFDEKYGELYGKQVLNRKFQYTFAIGTSLQTNLCRRLVVESEYIVQINPQPVIEVGNVQTFLSTNQTLQSIIHSLKKQNIIENNLVSKLETQTQISQNNIKKQHKHTPSNNKQPNNHNNNSKSNKIDDSKTKVDFTKKVTNKQISTKSVTNANANNKPSLKKK